MTKLQKLFLPIMTIFNPRTYREIKSLIKSENIEIVHVHNTLNLISPAVYYAARAMKVPVVQTVHNFRLVCPGATFYRDGHICEDCLGYGLKCSIKHSCYRGSKIQTLACALTLTIHRIMGIYKKINYICLTEFTKDKIKSVVDPERVYIKPNFVYDQKGSNQAEDYYIFVGRVEEIKGVNVLVDAFRSMPNKRLKIVGRGDQSEYIAARLEKEDIHNIELLGFKSHNEVNALLKHAKALIMCSQWYETFGMVIAEAYSNGVPAIVGRIGNIKDLVEESVTGELFVYDDPEDLIAAVERFESNGVLNTIRYYFSQGISKIAGHKDKERNKRISTLDEFVNEKLKLSEKKYDNSDYKQCNGYDIYISGSDQVWNPDHTFLSEFYCLNFAEPTSKRIAYAPSIGNPRLFYEDKAKIKKYLGEFAAVSVREALGTDILNRILVEDRVITMTDPTMLVPAYEWEAVLPEKTINSPYMFAYILRDTSEQRKYIKETAKSMSLRLIVYPTLEQSTGAKCWGMLVFLMTIHLIF